MVYPAHLFGTCRMHLQAREMDGIEGGRERGREGGREERRVSR